MAKRRKKMSCRVVRAKKSLAKRHRGAKWVAIRGGKRTYHRKKRAACK